MFPIWKEQIIINNFYIHIFSTVIKVFLFINSLSIRNCSIVIDRIYVSSRMEQHYKIYALLCFTFFEMFIYLTYHIIRRFRCLAFFAYSKEVFFFSESFVHDGSAIMTSLTISKAPASLSLIFHHLCMQQDKKII